MTFSIAGAGRRSKGTPLPDDLPDPGGQIVYRRRSGTLLHVWDETTPSGDTVRLARIRLGTEERTVFAYLLGPKESEAELLR